MSGFQAPAETILVLRYISVLHLVYTGTQECLVRTIGGALLAKKNVQSLFLDVGRIIELELQLCQHSVYRVQH